MGRRFVGIDSPSLTYLVEAIEPGYDPAADEPTLADQRVAMVRSYFYGNVQFWVIPTVETEYNRIRDPDRHLRHQQAAWTLLHDAPIRVPEDTINRRASELGLFHSGSADCRIVAEAELAGLAELVTFDGKLIDHLTGRTRLALARPSAFWQSLGIGPGAAPVLEPRPSNPLAHVDWWRL
jgi:predicted nucleic acid-binding protein